MHCTFMLNKYLMQKTEWNSGPGEKLVIHYKLMDPDIHSVIRLHEELDKWLRSCNCGKLEYSVFKGRFAKRYRNMSKDGLHQDWHNQDLRQSRKRRRQY